MYLLDTNILLEVLLDQEKADDVEKLLRGGMVTGFHLTNFSFYSTGIRLFREKRFDLFTRVVDDIIGRGSFQVVGLAMTDMAALADVSRQYRLDFDDAYQYVAAKKHDLMLVSFDADFDRTARGRKTPAEILKTL